MLNEELLARVADDPKFPTLPTLALQVIQEASRPGCTITDLGEIIAQDPMLCGKLLKLVNSAFFAVPRTVASIDRALTLLGLKRVQSLVLSLSLPGISRTKKTAPWLQDYWKCSVAGAVAAREFAALLKWPDPENELVAGLLRDLGMLILNEVCPDEYAEYREYPADQRARSQCELEQRILGFSHAEVGAYVLHRWHLPEEITEAVRFHHNPAGAVGLGDAIAKRAGLLYFASRIGQLQLTPNLSGLLEEIIHLARNRYGLGEAQLDKVLEPLSKKVEELAAMMEVKISPIQHIPSLVARARDHLTDLAVETSLDNIRISEEKEIAERERAKAEQALERAEQQFRQAQKMEAVGRLAGGVAHDFNNLLTVISGYCELLLEHLMPPSPLHRFVDEIKQASLRATGLTRQLLIFSRKQVLVPEVIDLNAVITELEKLLRRLLGEDVDFGTVLGPGVHPVTADAGQIEQVLMNLVINARDAMPNGGKITIATSNITLDTVKTGMMPELQPGDYVLLTVSDTGSGMTEEVKAHLFEPFFTTKEKNKGTGLGLATAYGIVKQTGGHIAVYSELGHGTTFKIYLPRSLGVAQPKMIGTTSAETPRGTETILLAEDEEAVRGIACKVLQMNGYRVLEARDGKHAAALSEGFPGIVDLLITDTIMPQMGGRELVDRIAPARPNMKVLYISGYTDDAVVRHGILTRGNHFLQKPFTPLILAKKVRAVLDGDAPAPEVPAAPGPQTGVPSCR